MRFKIILWIVCLLTLTACVHKPVQQSYRQVLPAVRQTQLTALSSWGLQGSFSLRQIQQSVVANYDWQQQASHYDLHISSPLNLFSIKILGEPGHVSLWRANKGLAEAPDPESLMQQQLGWQLPLSKLPYWIRGLPAPGRYQAKYDEWGHLIELEQEGWYIRYARYVSYGVYDLPSLLNLEDGSWSAKIFIKHWSLH